MELVSGKSRKSRKEGIQFEKFILENGKIPPQALDLEEAVLGAILLEKDALTSVIDLLKVESFYVDAHQVIYRTILDLFQTNKAIDLLTVSQELRKKGELDRVGGLGVLTSLTNKVGSTTNIEFYAKLISEKYILRELIRISSSIRNYAFEETTDVFELLDRTETELLGVAEGNIRKSYSTMGDLVAKAIKQLETIKNREDGLSGVPTGFKDLDALTGGFQKGNMIIVAARPSMGKTAFVLSMARNTAVDYNMGVAVFSLEMGGVELVNRLLSAEAEIAGEKIKNATISEQEWSLLTSKIDRLSQAPIYIDDSQGLNIFELRAKARRLKMQYDIQLIIIDYLQLMTAGMDKGGNREQEIASISRSIKNLAKELDIPIIALSQLNRSVETRGSTKTPQLSDLRESGSIEQDADVVMFIYRPEYYNNPNDPNGPSPEQEIEGLAQILVKKHRNGATGDVNLRFVKNYAKFVNLESNDYSFGGFNSFSNEAGNFISIASKINNYNFDEDDKYPNQPSF